MININRQLDTYNKKVYMIEVFWQMQPFSLITYEAQSNVNPDEQRHDEKY